MAPHVKVPAKKQHPTKRNKANSKEVRFRNKNLPVKRPDAVSKVPENYENLILYYLSKLKKLFANSDHPTSGVRENSGEKMRRELASRKTSKMNIEINPNKYTARQSTPRPHDSNMDNDIREKVYNVVNAAIEYGFRNNVIERKGNYFILKGRKPPKLADRQPTPGPGADRSLFNKCHCSKCKIAANTFKNSLPRPTTASSMGAQQFYSNRPNTNRPNSAHLGHLRQSRTYDALATNSTKSSAPFDKSPRSKCCSGTALDSLKNRPNKKCNCRKCYAVEQKRKIFKK